MDSPARRSCQNAMYHLIQALVRWFAPILSFTADEIWEAMPGFTGESIFLEQWYEAWPDIEPVDDIRWDRVCAIREEVNQALEAARKAGTIGSSLAAHVTLYASESADILLKPFGDELRFVLITSGVTLLPLQDKPEHVVFNDALGLAIEVTSVDDAKCVRCWHRVPDIGQDAEHPELCTRCVTNISGSGETRQWA